MPKLLFSQEELQMYFSGSLKHKAYDETVVDAFDLSIHSDGVYPQKMIEDRRPSESEQVKVYRKTIWKSITQPTWNKVLTELTKIRRSADWSITYDPNAVPPKVVEGETLQKYCEENYPYFESVTNWAFSALLPLYAKDANAVIAVIPVEIPNESNVYLKPYAYLFDSCNVYDFKQEDYAVIKSTDTVIMTDNDGRKTFGSVFYIMTTMWVERYAQISSGGKFMLSWRYDHNLGKLPAFRTPGIVKKTLDDTIVYRSKVGAMRQRLDEAVREYSDLQAGVVGHLYPERWEIADECPKCKGKKVLYPAGFNAPSVKCDECGGSGNKPRNPYTTMYVKYDPSLVNNNMPMPPAGYVERDVEILKLQDERIDKHEFKALAAINMEYLANTPLSQSGQAKEVDRDPASTFCNSVAEDIVYAMDYVYELTNDYRYAKLIPDEEDRKAMNPFVKVPDKFDLLSSTYLEEQITKQKENKGNPVIIKAMEKDYVSKKFVGDNTTMKRVTLCIDLDPLAGLSEDDKMTRLSNKGISQATYVISSNIQEFIDRAIDEKGDKFYSMKLKEQKLLLKAYADEQIQEESAMADVIPLQTAEGAPLDPAAPESQNNPNVPPGKVQPGKVPNQQPAAA